MANFLPQRQVCTPPRPVYILVNLQLAYIPIPQACSPLEVCTHPQQEVYTRLFQPYQVCNPPLGSQGCNYHYPKRACNHFDPPAVCILLLKACTHLQLTCLVSQLGHKRLELAHLRLLVCSPLPLQSHRTGCSSWWPYLFCL